MDKGYFLTWTTGDGELSHEFVIANGIKEAREYGRSQEGGMLALTMTVCKRSRKRPWM